MPVEARPLRAIRCKGITSFQELLSIARQMKVFRTSKMPWLRILGRLARGLGRLIKTAAMLGMLGLVVTVMLWRSRGCFTESLANIPGVSGFNFEVSMTDCWHNPETGVFVAERAARTG